MLAIMLDPHFKIMIIIQNCGKCNIIEAVVEYDAKVVYPFMLQVYFYLNFTRVLVEGTTIEDDDFFGGHIISNDDVIKSTLNNDLQLFCRLCVM